MTVPRCTPSKPAAAVVAVALEHAAERLLAGAEARAAAVVLEARRARGARRGPASSTSIATLPIRRGAVRAHRVQVDEPDAGDALVAELVVVAEQLDAAADAEHDGAAAGRGVQRVALGLDEVLGAERLVAVLAAAEVEEVVGVGVDRVAEAGGRSARSRCRATRSAARAAAGCRGRRRCSSGRGRARRRAGAAQPRRITTVEPTYSSVGRRSARAVAACSPMRLGLRRRARPASSAVEADDVVLPRRARSRRRRCSRAGGGSRAGRPRRDGQRAARCRRRRRRRDVGHRQAVDLGLEALQRVGERQRRAARPGPSARGAARRNARAALGAAEQLQRSASARVISGEAALAERRSRGRRPTTVSHRRGPPRRALAQRREQLGLGVAAPRRRCPRAARSSATRPVPAPTSSTGPPAASARLAPQRQVVGVAAALEVVPDDGGHGHPKQLPRHAARDQLSRSSSIAV